MSSNFAGVDHYQPGTNLAGKGVWPVNIQVADDGDNRDAATAMMAAEGAINRTVYIAHRFVNGLESNTSITAYPADIYWDGDHTFKAGTLTTIAGVLTIPGGISGNVSIAGSLTVTVNQTVNGNLTVAGTATFNDPATFNDTATFNDPATFSDTVTCTSAVTCSAGLTVSGGPLERVGADAYAGLRSAIGPNASTTINAWENDVWTAVISANRDWTLNDPPTGKVIRVTFFAPPNNTLTLKTSGGTTIASLLEAANNTRSVVLIWNKTSWYIESARVV